MPTISKDDFLAGLKKSKVVDSEVLEKWLAEGSYETPQSIAGGLVKAKMLTKWQAKFLMSGRTRLDLGSYRLLERVQRDELGDRFLALHTSLDRKVDIQVLPAALTKDKQRFNTFIKKATTAAKLDHPNIVHVYDIDQEGGRYFLVTEHFEGIALNQKPKSELSEAFIAKLTRDVVDGLKYAHKNNVVHGSITPLDLVFTNDGVIKLDHVALSPLRKSSEEAAATPKQDYASISKIGLALIKNLPEEKTTSNLDALKLAVASIQSGQAEIVDQALSSMEKMDLADDVLEVDLDPLDLGAVGSGSGSGGFDSPMATTQVRKPKKKASPEPEEEFVEPKPLGIIGTLWHTNPVAVIATSVVLGLLLVGGGIYGIMNMGKDPVTKKTPPTKNTPKADVSPTDDNKNAPKLDNPETGTPDFSDTEAMEKRIAEMLEGNSETPEKQKSPSPKNKPPEDKSKEPGSTEGFPFKSPVIGELVKLEGVDIPVNTPVVIKFISEAGWAEVDAKLPGNQTKSGWIKATQITEAAQAANNVAANNAANTTQVSLNNATSNPNTPATMPANNGLTATPKTPDPETAAPIPDRLDKIFGIGEKTQDALYAAGILTFKQLGTTTPQKIRDALGNKIATRTDKDFNKWINDARGLAGLEGQAPPMTSSSSTAAKTPDSTPPKKAVPDNPFTNFPRITGLPEVADTKEMKIAPLTIKKTHLLAIEVLCIEGFSRTKLIFDLTRADKAGGTEKSDKQKWFVGVKRRASETSDHIGIFRKSEDAFHFQWLPEAEKNKYAEYLRNCFVRLKLPNDTQAFLSLRKPMKVHDLRIGPEHLANKLEFSIPAMPHPDTVVMEVTPMRVKGTETNVINARIEKGIPGMIYLKRNDKTGFLRLQVAGELKSKVRLQSNLILLAQGQVQPVTNLAVFDTLKAQIAQEKSFRQNELRNAKNEGEKKSIQAKINKADGMAALMLTYEDTLSKLWNQPISIRVYSKLGNYQLMLAQSDPSVEQPKKRR